MYRAGDWVAINHGPRQGETCKVASVRRYAADPGYYVQGGDGLYPPQWVTLARTRTGGNPCGRECVERTHAALGDCEHCRGVCSHESPVTAPIEDQT